MVSVVSLTPIIIVLLVVIMESLAYIQALEVQVVQVSLVPACSLHIIVDRIFKVNMQAISVAMCT